MKLNKSVCKYMKSQMGRFIIILLIMVAGTQNQSHHVDHSLLSGVSGALQEPFGELATPFNGSVIRGSVPVTGWVLDDSGVESVKIYRESNELLVYLGDAVMVEGARPDVEAAYPDYPDNSSAGWGYMLLTNLLPDEGNGWLTIHAVAVDIDGNEATLGTKTLLCDNDNRQENAFFIDRSRTVVSTLRHVTRDSSISDHTAIDKIPHIKSSEPVIVKTGSHAESTSELIYPNRQGIVYVEIRELQRLELRFFPSDGSRKLIGRDRLPIGSTLDPNRGICIIMPSPGYVGVYPLIFDVQEVDGTIMRHEVLVNILPLSFQRFP